MAHYVSHPTERRTEFYRYYDKKRMLHQQKQLEMLRDVPGDQLVEIGPFLGFATALFQAAGFEVKTVDAGTNAVFGKLTVKEHVQSNVRDVTPEMIKGADALVCCETLEHLPFSESERVLGVFRDSEIPYVLISVPYRCFSIDVRIMKSKFSSFFSWIVKFPSKKFQEFVPDPSDPDGHKWELGYKGYPVERLLSALDRTGFDVEAIEYVGVSRSIMILSKNRASRPDA